MVAGWKTGGVTGANPTWPRLYVQDLEGGKPRAITAEGAAASFFEVSPDGSFWSLLARTGTVGFSQ